MSNVIADVRVICAKAIKAKDTTTQPPSKWATAAGYTGSAASPLRDHIARASHNGCGRQGRYPAVTAEGMLELLDLGDAYKAAEDARKATIAKRIGSKVRPTVGKTAKAQAKRSATTRKATPRKRTAAKA